VCEIDFALEHKITFAPRKQLYAAYHMSEITDNYAGIPDEFATEQNSKIVLIPVPYDGTSTWVKGADLGPDAFLDASANMELYDIETDSEVYRQGVYLDEAVQGHTSPESMVDEVHKRVKSWLEKDKYVTIVGGEHSITIGCVRAFREKFENLTVLQIDAHADLRPEYEGSACNHACAVYEASKTTNLIQVGIRSMDVSEKEHMNMSKTFFAHTIAATPDDVWMQQVLDLCTENVFITIDLDGFDPSILPSTGTPEPGGLSYYQVLNLIKKVIQHKKLVGFDIMELCPNETERSSDFFMAKLYYKMLTYQFEAAGKLW
jgi:agmatinase